MTEDEAREWLAARATAKQMEHLSRFTALLEHEAERQNLVSRSTLTHLWSRHIADSAQLLMPVGSGGGGGGGGLWLDVGSGAGLPGIIVAILSDREVLLCEPRRLRAEFLIRSIKELGLTARVTVRQTKVEHLTAQAGTISARAVAPLADLLEMAVHCATSSTTWLLPKGRSAEAEVEIARRRWQGMFHVKQSVTDPNSAIVVATRVVRRR